MLEYTADAVTKTAMARAHAERGKVLKQALSRLFGKKPAPAFRPRVSRWA